MDVDSEISEMLAGLRTGTSATYTRTVTRELIRQFADVSGDMHPLHVDEDYCAKQPFGRPIAHGALLVGFMSTASTLLSEQIERDTGRANVSLGYDRLRFIKPVFAGDIIVTTIKVSEILPEAGRVMCEEECRTDIGDVVAVGTHVMRFV